MRTRSQSRNNFPQQEASPTIVEPLFIELPFLEDQFQEDPPVDPPEVPMADNRTMAELLQAPIEGYEDAIIIPKIAANNFELKHGLINLVQNKQFFGHDKEDPHAHIRYFNKITSTMRVPNVPSSSIKLMLFPFSLEGAARIWLKKEAPRSILTWDDLVTKFINQACLHHGFSELHQLNTFYNALNVNDQDSLNSAAGGNFLDKMPRECLKIIESKSKVRQSRAKVVVAKVSTNSSTPAVSFEVSELKDMVRALLLDKKNQSSTPASSSTSAPVKAIEPNCVTCGGAHSYQNCPATSRNIYRDNIQEYVSQAVATNYNQENTCFRPQMVANQIRPPSFPPHQNHQNNFNRGNNFNQNQGGAGTLPSNTITNPKEDLKGITTQSGAAYQKPTIPTQSKVVKQETEVTKDQVQTPSSQSTAPVQPPVTQSKTQTPVSEPVVAPVSVPIPYPSRRDNERRRDQANEQIEKFYEIFKEMKKLSEMSRTSMNEHCLAVILNKLPRKLGDPSKFLIPCEFLGMDECLALADLGASINLMPLSVWEGLLLLKLTLTCMTLKLADRSISKPIGIAKDVSVKVGVYHFPADFVVVDFEPDPRVHLILERCFLKTGRTLIDVHKGELTLCIRNEAITYNLDQTEADAFLGLEDDPDSPKINPFYYDLERDILLLEAILNREPLPPLPNHEQYMPSYKKELKVCEAKIVKSSIDEPPEVELKDLPPHLEYAFLEGDNKFPVIIAKELGDEEKSALIKVLKSHNPWVSPVHCVPKKGGFTVIENEENKLIPTRLVTGWRVCIDYQKLNEATRKYHFPLPFMDQMLERLAGNEYYYFLDGFSGCMLAIFHDMVEKTMKVFMDDFLVFGNSFENCLSRLDKMLQRCEDTNLSLNWEKSHFRVKEGIVLGQKISKNEIEVDRAKVDVIAKLPHPTTVKGIRSFLGHADFYWRFIQDFSKISRPMTHLLEKNTPFIFSEDFIKAFQTLKKRLTKAPILIAPNWDLPFELMCDASNFAIGAILGQRHERHFKPIHYASKTMNDAESNYTTTEKEMLAVVFSSYRAIISDRGTHFCNDQFAKVMLKYGVTHRLSIAYHPQTIGKVEAFRTAYKTPIGCTPYKVVYGKACHLPIELEHKAYWALKQANFYLAVTGDLRKVQLNELNELHDHAYENSLIYKEKTKRIHDFKIKTAFSTLVIESFSLTQD
uniref:DNA-directed DNA polymerase n=1 Tax=Tanacetum cinerariifolium TaxID=118510 RepID=A0A6L2JK80_TANCI|nr:DNA-directed DNA polymerase [Tanacetum cinerariifolium]